MKEQIGEYEIKVLMRDDGKIHTVLYVKLKHFENGEIYMHGKNQIFLWNFENDPCFEIFNCRKGKLVG